MCTTRVKLFIGWLGVGCKCVRSSISIRSDHNKLGCTIQKGEFGYNLGDDWDCVSFDGQKTCLKYLQGDVLGIKQKLL